MVMAVALIRFVWQRNEAEDRLILYPSSSQGPLGQQTQWTGSGSQTETAEKAFVHATSTPITLKDQFTFQAED